MAKKTYKGSCHCKKIRFEADIDLAEGTAKCNCTSCFKRRWWSVRVQPESFRPLGGEQLMSGYKAGQDKGHTGFCTSCGVIPYGWGAGLGVEPHRIRVGQRGRPGRRGSGGPDRRPGEVCRRPQRQLVERTSGDPPPVGATGSCSIEGSVLVGSLSPRTAADGERGPEFRPTPSRGPFATYRRPRPCRRGYGFLVNTTRLLLVRHGATELTAEDLFLWVGRRRPLRS